MYTHRDFLAVFAAGYVYNCRPPPPPHHHLLLHHILNLNTTDPNLLGHFSEIRETVVRREQSQHQQLPRASCRWGPQFRDTWAQPTNPSVKTSGILLLSSRLKAQPLTADTNLKVRSPHSHCLHHHHHHRFCIPVVAPGLFTFSASANTYDECSLIGVCHHRSLPFRNHP